MGKNVQGFRSIIGRYKTERGCRAEGGKGRKIGTIVVA